MHQDVRAISFVQPGRQAIDWLTRTLAEFKANDPLQPATIAVPNHVAGRFLLRQLAPKGLAVNTRVVRVVELAAQIVGPVGAQGVLTPVAERIAVQAAIREAGGPLLQMVHHRSLLDALGRLFRELRQLEIGIEVLPRAGMSEMAVSSLNAYRAFRRLTQRHLDPTSLRDAATRALKEGRSSSGPKEEIGPFILFLPTRLDPADARLLAALAQLVPFAAAFSHFPHDDVANVYSQKEAAALASQLGLAAPTLDPSSASRSSFDVSSRIIRAPDPAEEIREVARQVAADLEQGIPLHRIAVLYRQADPYGPLVREALDLAELPWSALDGRPLADTSPGRALLSLLEIRERQFSREAVLSWVDTGSEATRLAYLPASAWDRISRAANVVRGADQWASRLNMLADSSEQQATQYEMDGSQAQANRLRWDATGARAMLEAVTRLADALQPPLEPHSWSDLVAWVEQLRKSYALVADQDRDGKADELVGQTLEDLGESDRFETEASVDLIRFLDAVESELAQRTIPEGRLGHGVTLGPVQSVTGLTFDRVYLVGLVEGRFPPVPAADPFFLVEEQDPTSRRDRQRSTDRRAFLTALESTDKGQITLSVPESLGGQVAYPSHWLIEVVRSRLAEDGTDAFLDAQRFRALREQAHSWLRIVRSGQDGVERSVVPADMEDRRLREAATWRGAGRPLRAHPLATRADLPIGLGLRVADARRSPALTVHDGSLAELSGESSRLARLLNGSATVSASAMQTWAKCPFSYFLGRVLYVQPTQRPDDQWTISPLEQGSLFHGILDRFFKALGAEGRPAPSESYGARDVDVLQSIAEQEFNEVERRGATGHPLAWESTKPVLLGDLRFFLGEDERWRSEGGWRPSHFEQAFGTNAVGAWPAVEVAAGDGTLHLLGYIDRVDVSQDGTQAYLFDYKTGRSYAYRGLDEDPVLAGKEIQLALYSQAVKGAIPGLTEVGAAYWFATSRGEFKRLALPSNNQAVEQRLRGVLGLITQGITRGVFPAVPGDEDRESFSNCMYCEYDRICPSARDIQWEQKQADGCESFLNLIPQTSSRTG